MILSYNAVLTRTVLIQQLLDNLIGNRNYTINVKDNMTIITIPDATNANTVDLINRIINMITPVLVPGYLTGLGIPVAGLVQASPAQIQTYINTNVTSLAQAQVYLYYLTLVVQTLLVQAELFPTS